jgi:ribonuclease BN (tRNA processing enzyme)
VNGRLSVMVLGSGGAIAAERMSPGYLVFTDGQPRILMDVGGGTFASLGKSGVDLSKLDIILFSHLHIDTTADLPAVLKSVYLHNLRAKTKRPGEQFPFRFFGPAANPANPKAAVFDSTSTFIEKVLGKENGIYRYIHGFSEKVVKVGRFGYTATDVSADLYDGAGATKNPAKVQTILSTDDGLVIKAIGVHHGSAPTLAYRIEYKGKSLVYSGDTNSKTDNLITLAEGADMLIYDSALLDDKPPKDNVFRKAHPSPTRIGQVASRSNVRELILSHVSPITDGHEETIKAVVAANGFKGKATQAKDLDIFNLL